MSFSDLVRMDKEKSERMHLSLFWFLLFVFFILFDQATKFAAEFLFAFSDVVLSKKFFDFQLFRNYHFAFSLNVPTLLMYAIYSIVIAGVLWHVRTSWARMSFTLRFSWIIILAGAVSNIAERIVLGYVRDFIKINTGYFNVADVYIFVGMILVIIFSSSRFAKNER